MLAYREVPKVPGNYECVVSYKHVYMYIQMYGHIHKYLCKFYAS